MSTNEGPMSDEAMGSDPLSPEWEALVAFVATPFDPDAEAADVRRGFGLLRAAVREETQAERANWGIAVERVKVGLLALTMRVERLGSRWERPAGSPIPTEADGTMVGPEGDEPTCGSGGTVLGHAVACTRPAGHDGNHNDGAVTWRRQEPRHTWRDAGGCAPAPEGSPLPEEVIRRGRGDLVQVGGPKPEERAGTERPEDAVRRLAHEIVCCHSKLNDVGAVGDALPDRLDGFIATYRQTVAQRDREVEVAIVRNRERIAAERAFEGIQRELVEAGKDMLRRDGETEQGWTIWRGAIEVECPECGLAFSSEACDVAGYEDQDEPHYTCPLCETIEVCAALDRAGVAKEDEGRVELGLADRTRLLAADLAAARAQLAGLEEAAPVAAPPGGEPSEAAGIVAEVLGRAIRAGEEWTNWNSLSEANDLLARIAALPVAAMPPAAAREVVWAYARVVERLDSDETADGSAAYRALEAEVDRLEAEIIAAMVRPLAALPVEPSEPDERIGAWHAVWGACVKAGMDTDAEPTGLGCVLAFVRRLAALPGEPVAWEIEHDDGTHQLAYNPGFARGDRTHDRACRPLGYLRPQPAGAPDGLRDWIVTAQRRAYGQEYRSALADVLAQLDRAAPGQHGTPSIAPSEEHGTVSVPGGLRELREKVRRWSAEAEAAHGHLNDEGDTAGASAAGQKADVLDVVLSEIDRLPASSGERWEATISDLGLTHFRRGEITDVQLHKSGAPHRVEVRVLPASGGGA